MPLVVDQLQLWAVGFKWAGFDPNHLWLRIPVTVRDNFSTLLDAILSEHLECLTLASEKYAGDDPELAKCHIRFWLDDVYAAIHGTYYNRKLLKWAVIERGAFRDWCERRSIALPEFWFPPGWTEYRWPEYDPRGAGEGDAGGVAVLDAAPPEALPGPGGRPPKELRDSQIARIASQRIAREIWKDHPDMTIAAVCKEDLVQRYGGAQYYAEEVVRRWIKEVAPTEVSAKRGRPKKKTPTEDS